MLTVVLSILLLALVIFTIWNLISTKRLSKGISSSTPKIDDSKYFELKYRQDFLVAAFSLVAGIAAFLGYNSKESIEKNLTTEIETKLKEPKVRIDSLSNSVSLIDSEFNSIRRKADDYTARLQVAEVAQDAINAKSKRYNSEMGELLSRINELNKKNILKQDIYVIDGIYYDSRNGANLNGWKKYYFKDLKTILGDKLPSFKKAPFLLPVSRQGAIVNIDSITRESFYMTIWNQAPVDNEKFEWNRSYINLLIAEIPD